MASSPFKKVDVLRGPFDPGGQPQARTQNAMEFGFFAWNIKGGMTASEVVQSDPPRLQNFWEWPTASRLIRLAEDVGFDYQVPYARWIGQGGSTDYNGASLDFLASAAATAPITSRMGVFSTAHITFKFHPLHIAKFGATIDHISNGRWGLNIVTGYSPRENAAFGMKEPIEHDEAYAMADEFVCLMKYLWSETERFDFEGKYYQAYGVILAPKPTRNPRPVLMNAGNSDVGLDFGVRNSDWIFTNARSLDGFPERVRTIKEKAANYKRTVRASAMCWCLIEATDEIAKAKYDWIASGIDREATRSFLLSMAGKSDAEIIATVDDGDPYAGIGKDAFERMALGLRAPQIMGGPQTVAEQIKHLHDCGIESLLFGFFDPLKGLHMMQDEVMPILRKMGIRS
jgi:FMNH2-dependent dimethyl sulfone monooxygenase